nr:RNA-dependent RNA polymerase [Molussus totiviridae 2]
MFHTVRGDVLIFVLYILSQLPHITMFSNRLIAAIALEMRTLQGILPVGDSFVCDMDSTGFSSSSVVKVLNYREAPLLRMFRAEDMSTTSLSSVWARPTRVDGKYSQLWTHLV